MPKNTQQNQYPGLRNASDRLILEKYLQLLDGNNIQFGKLNGTQIGTEATQMLAFYGKTPIVQPGAISTPGGGTVIDIQARAAIVSIITALVNLGLIA